MNQEIICIGCPVGCSIHVETDAEGNLSVQGNACPRGAKYACQESVAPMRIVTGSVPVRGGTDLRVSVKTSAAVPKDKIFEVMTAIHVFEADAPVRIHDVLIAHVCGTEADVVATSKA